MEPHEQEHVAAHSKTLLALQRLARDLLGRQVGERLPTTFEYQRLLRVGSGTVQNSFQYLAGTGAAAFRANGRRGTFLTGARIDRLWALADLPPVMGVLPLLVSAEWAGLATGLRSEFGRIGIPLQTLHVHGSYRRVEMVAEGKADFALMSKEAAEHITASSQEKDWTILDLGPHTYYGVDSLVVLFRPGLESAAHSEEAEREAVRRVGIDRTAYDHARLTGAEFPEREGYEYVGAKYPYMPADLLSGKIDAAVWNRQMLILPLESIGIAVRPLRRPESVTASRSMSNAVLLGSGARPDVATVLRHVSREEIATVQSHVLAEKMMPMY